MSALTAAQDNAITMGGQQHGRGLGTGTAPFQHVALASAGMRSVGPAPSGGKLLKINKHLMVAMFLA